MRGRSFQCEHTTFCWEISERISCRQQPTRRKAFVQLSIHESLSCSVFLQALRWRHIFLNIKQMHYCKDWQRIIFFAGLVNSPHAILLWASCGKPPEFCEDEICAVVQPAELRRSFNKFMDVSVCAATLQLLPGRSCPASSAARNSEATVRLSIHDVDAGYGCLKGKARLAASCF